MGRATKRLALTNGISTIAVKTISLISLIALTGCYSGATIVESKRPDAYPLQYWAVCDHESHNTPTSPNWTDGRMFNSKGEAKEVAAAHDQENPGHTAIVTVVGEEDDVVADIEYIE